MVTNVDWWESLDENIRGQLTAIIDDVTVTRNAEAYKVNQANKAAVLEAGGVVRELTAEQRAEWVTAMKPVWEQFKDDVGQTNIDAAQAINAAIN